MKPAPWNRFRQQAIAFVKNTEGAATIEIVIWVPVFALLLGLMADTALIYGGKSRILRVVQDSNRAMSIGRITTTADLEDEIELQLAGLSQNAVATAMVQNGIISSTVVIPVADLTATKLVDAFDGLEIAVSSQHMAEN